MSGLWRVLPRLLKRPLTALSPQGLSQLSVSGGSTLSASHSGGVVPACAEQRSGWRVARCAESGWCAEMADCGDLTPPLSLCVLPGVCGEQVPITFQQPFTEAKRHVKSHSMGENAKPYPLKGDHNARAKEESDKPYPVEKPPRRRRESAGAQCAEHSAEARPQAAGTAASAERAAGQHRSLAPRGRLQLNRDPDGHLPGSCFHGRSGAGCPANLASGGQSADGSSVEWRGCKPRRLAEPERQPGRGGVARRLLQLPRVPPSQLENKLKKLAVFQYGRRKVVYSGGIR